MHLISTFGFLNCATIIKEEEIENIKYAEQRKRGNASMTNANAEFIIILKMFGSKHEYTDEQT